MDEFRIKIDGFRCLRCNWEWTPRENTEMPIVCPNPHCKSAYWNKQRKNKQNEQRLKK